MIINNKKQDHRKNHNPKEEYNLCEDNNVIEESLNCFSRTIRSTKNDQSFFEHVRAIVTSLMGLSGEQRVTLEKLLCQYEHLFSDEVGCAKIYEHSIKLATNKPFVKRSYPIPLKYREAVDLELQNMLRERVIERSNSPFCNPLRIVPKNKGGVRICIDARHLNNIIESDNESPPLIEELMRKHHGVKVMTTTDLTHGYWQIPLEKNSRKFTAFVYIWRYGIPILQDTFRS